jgi:hypothetical protein
MKSFKTFDMFIQVMQRVCRDCFDVTLARKPVSRSFYVLLIFGYIFATIVHTLSTEYINIWYATSSIDTKYSGG